MSKRSTKVEPPAPVNDGSFVEMTDLNVDKEQISTTGNPPEVKGIYEDSSFEDSSSDLDAERADKMSGNIDETRREFNRDFNLTLE